MTQQNKKVKTDRLFYDQYRYSVTGYIAEAGCLRSKTPEELERRLQVAELRYNWRRKLATNSVPAEFNRDSIIELHNQLQRLPNIKRLIHTDWVTFFTNDVDALQQAGILAQLKHIVVKQAVVSRARDTVVLQSSDYAYRTYFKERRLDTAEVQRFYDFLRTQREEIRLSPGLVTSMAHNYRYFTSNLFIDHNNPGYEMLINLVTPNLVRKTMPIIIAK